jgi:hypothetical protein
MDMREDIKRVACQGQSVRVDLSSAETKIRDNFPCCSDGSMAGLAQGLQMTKF